MTRTWQKIVEWPLLVFLTSSSLPLNVNNSCGTSLGCHLKLLFPKGFLFTCHLLTHLKLYSLTILNFHFLSVGPLPLRFRQVSLLSHLPISLPQNSNCLVSPDSLFRSQFRHTVCRSLPWLPLNKLTPTYILPIVLLCLYMSPKQNTPIGAIWELIKIQIPSIYSPDLVGLV